MDLEMNMLMKRLEKRLLDMGRTNALLSSQIEDAENDLSTLRAMLGQAGQPELPLEPPAAGAPVPPIRPWTP